ncbi:50S ribosomal protein L20 [Candidatus Margulisiibacteriota bacterium]
MARTKRGNVLKKRHKKVLKLTKGYRGAKSKLFRPAHQAMLKALTCAFADRRKKKRDFRGLWIIRISAALKQFNVSYSNFIGKLKKKNIIINRKMLSELAIKNPDIFNNVVKQANK